MPEFTKTIKLKLNVTQNQIVLFKEMTEQYRKACNFVSQYVFSHDYELNSNVLQKALYTKVRSSFGLKSQLAQSTFKTVTARYKTVQTQLSKNPFKYKDENDEWQTIPKTLEWLWKPVVFYRPQADLVRNRDYSFLEDGKILSLNTLQKRVKCTFEGDFYSEYLDGSWNLGTGKLVEPDSKCIADAIDTMYATENRIVEMSKRAKEFADYELTWAHSAELLINFVKTIV